MLHVNSLVILFSALLYLNQDIVNETQDKQVTQLIRQLNSEDLEDRFLATQKLEELGHEILPILKRQKASISEEVSQRLKPVMDRLEVKKYLSFPPKPPQFNSNSYQLNLKEPLNPIFSFYKHMALQS